MSKDEIKFLEILAKHTRPLSRSQLCQITRQRFATEADTKARAACKRKGYAEFVGGNLGHGYEAMGWRITPAGRAALAESSNA